MTKMDHARNNARIAAAQNGANLSEYPRKRPISYPEYILDLKGVNKLTSHHKALLKRFFKETSFEQRTAAISYILGIDEQEARGLIKAIERCHREQDTFIPWPTVKSG